MQYVQDVNLSKILDIPSQKFLLAACVKSILDTNIDTEIIKQCVEF